MWRHETGSGAAYAFFGRAFTLGTSQTLCRISRGSVHHVHKQLNRMMSRLHRATACLRGKLVSQYAGSTLEG